MRSRPESEPAERATLRWPSAFAWVAVATIAVLLAQLLSLLDWRGAVRLVSGVGAGVLLLPIPYAAMLILDAAAWRSLLPQGAGPRFGERLRVRTVAEAISTVLPLGGVGGDAAAIALLRQVDGPNSTAVTASLVARRVLLGLAHGIAVFLGGVVLGWAGPARLAAFAWTFAAVGATVTVACGLAVRWMRAGSRSTGLRSLGRRMPRRLPWRLGIRVRRIAGLSSSALAPALAASLRRPARPTILYVGLFLVEAVETWLILRLLGGGLDLLPVLSFDAPLSLLRSVVPLVPAGLGAQDIAYAGALVAWSVPAAASVAAALVVLKRSKEVMFAFLGALLWGLPRLGHGLEQRRLRCSWVA